MTHSCLVDLAFFLFLICFSIFFFFFIQVILQELVGRYLEHERLHKCRCSLQTIWRILWWILPWLWWLLLLDYSAYLSHHTIRSSTYCEAFIFESTNCLYLRRLLRKGFLSSAHQSICTCPHLNRQSSCISIINVLSMSHQCLVSCSLMTIIPLAKWALIELRNRIIKREQINTRIITSSHSLTLSLFKLGLVDEMSWWVWFLSFGLSKWFVFKK